jgi:putative intracellular protease/amidase
MKRIPMFSKDLPRRALIALSSFDGAIFPDGSKTGVFFTEALHPFEVLTAAGFDVDFASETGSYAFDEISLLPPFLAGSDKAVYENQKHPFMVAMKSKVLKAAELKGSDYGLFFASAGHAALYDYPNARGLQVAAEDVWNGGGIVGAVCHGPVLLPGVIDSKTGKSIIADKTVTGFTVDGEIVLGVLDRLKSDKVVVVPDAVSKAGADYSSPMLAFDDYSITAGRLITGTNPASARSAAERSVRAFASLGNG